MLACSIVKKNNSQLLNCGVFSKDTVVFFRQMCNEEGSRLIATKYSCFQGSEYSPRHQASNISAELANCALKASQEVGLPKIIVRDFLVEY